MNEDLKTLVHKMSNIDHRSIDERAVYAIEECSELIKELTKHQRGSGSDRHIYEEACDVLATLLPIFDILGATEDQIMEEIKRKYRIAIMVYEKEHPNETSD